MRGDGTVDWWCHFLSSILQLGHIEGEPMRRGAFPVTFVLFISDWQAGVTGAERRWRGRACLLRSFCRGLLLRCLHHQCHHHRRRQCLCWPPPPKRDSVTATCDMTTYTPLSRNVSPSLSSFSSLSLSSLSLSLDQALRTPGKMFLHVFGSCFFSYSSSCGEKQEKKKKKKDCSLWL